MTLVEKYNKLKKAFSNLKAKYKTVKAALHLAIDSNAKLVDSNAKLVDKLHIASVKLHISHDMIITLSNKLDSVYEELKTQHEILCKLNKENIELQSKLNNRGENDNDNDIILTTFRFNDENSNELYTIPTTRQGVDILSSFTTKARAAIDKAISNNEDLKNKNAMLNRIIIFNGGLDKLKSNAYNKHCGANSQPDTDLRYTDDGCCRQTNKYKSNNVPTVLIGLVGLLLLGVMVELMILLVK